MTSGHWEYLVILYVRVNAPSVFQAFINDVLRDMLKKLIIAYFDDVLIF